MKLHELDSTFVRRLENWGEYFGGGIGGGPNTSPTYEVCKLLAIRAGKEVQVGFATSNPRPEIDEEDAMIMERHWAMCAYRVPMLDRALIKAHWVHRRDPRAVCRVLKLRFLSWEHRLCEAVLRFQRAVELLEGCTSSGNAR